MSILDEIKNRAVQPSVTTRKDILFPKADEEAEVSVIVARDNTAQTLESKLEGMKKQLADYPIIANQQPIRLETEIKTKVEDYCRSNKVTLETLVEALFEEAETQNYLNKVVPRAQERLKQRKEMGNLKTKITQLGNLLKG